MALTDPSNRRLKPVRLTDIPYEQRMRAAREACRHCRDLTEVEELLAAAWSPSDRTYYVAFDKAA